MIKFSLLMLFSFNLHASYLEMYEERYNYVSETCEKTSNDICFDFFLDSTSSEGKFNLLVLYVSEENQYKHRINDFIETLKFLITSGHKNSIILYSTLLSTGEIFIQDTNTSIELIKSNINYGNDPYVLYILSFALFEKFKITENYNLLKEAEKHLKKSYTNGFTNSGVLLAIIYLSYSKPQKVSDALNILNKLREEKNPVAESLYNEYLQSLENK